jgi:hypothetical protein
MHGRETKETGGMEDGGKEEGGREEGSMEDGKNVEAIISELPFSPFPFSFVSFVPFVSRLTSDVSLTLLPAGLSRK